MANTLDLLIGPPPTWNTVKFNPKLKISREAGLICLSAEGSQFMFTPKQARGVAKAMIEMAEAEEREEKGGSEE
jgi:hypothetical protein